MKSKQKGLLWITLGLLLIAAALSLAACNLFDGLRAERSSMQIVNKLDEVVPPGTMTETPAGSQEQPPHDVETELPDYALNPYMEMPQETIDGISFIGILRIPALGLELPVAAEWNYPNLKAAPCRYSGSAYLDNLVICGHNYPSHFGNLKNLQEGDIVTFTDMDGNIFTYRLVERETLLPAEIGEMKSGDWDLTLFTCSVGGQSRVTLRFEKEIS